MNKISNEGVGPVIGEAVEALANMLKTRTAPNPPASKKNELGMETTSDSTQFKAAGEFNLGDMWEQATKGKHIPVPEPVKPKLTKKPNTGVPLNIGKAKLSPSGSSSQPSGGSFKDKVFSHLTKHKIPYSVGGAAVGLTGAAMLGKHLKDKEQLEQR